MNGVAEGFIGTVTQHAQTSDHMIVCHGQMASCGQIGFMDFATKHAVDFRNALYPKRQESFFLYTIIIVLSNVFLTLFLHL
jgi:hypothetical protein